jgi:hypothetical protein
VDVSVVYLLHVYGVAKIVDDTFWGYNSRWQSNQVFVCYSWLLGVN